MLNTTGIHFHYVFRHGSPTLTRGRRGTGLAGSVPGFAHVIGAAAHLLGHVEGELVLAGVVEVAVAHALSHICETEPRMSSGGFDSVLNAHRAALTHAVVSSVHLHVLGRTDAGVVPQRVVAGSRTTDADVCRTFINI